MRRYLLPVMCLLGAALLPADEEMVNDTVVCKAADGKLVAKSVPAEGHGTAGETTVFRVSKEGDVPELTFKWYSREIFLLATDAGISTVRFGPWHGGSQASAKDLALEFYLGPKLLKSYSTLDIAKKQGNVSATVSHYTVIEKTLGYGRIDGKKDVFEVVTVDGRKLTFDIKTGEIVGEVKTGA